LIFFGTGIRFRSALTNVIAKLGNTEVQVGYAGAQGDFVGLDQVNLLLPRSLRGLGDIGAMVIADGDASNSVRINIH
jgi:uncharacterized protein (TIGR03437 family)